MTTYTLETASRDTKLIRRINKVFHDVEAETYKDNHPEIFSYEARSWRDLFADTRSKHINDSNITVLDVGTGTGFVPLAIAQNLNNNDTLIATDISEAMLHQAKKTISQFNFNKKFIQIENGYKDVASSSVDIVTMNSVLHHIPDLEALFREIDRVLKPGGCLIIKHEPNIRFVKNKILRFIYLSLKRVRGSKVDSSQYVETPMHLKVVKKLEEEGIVFEPRLSAYGLQSLVDIHSPTASGGMVTERGFDPYGLAHKYFAKAETVSCRTYGYLGKIRDDSNSMRKLVSGILRCFAPKSGYFFDVVIKKS